MRAVPGLFLSVAVLLAAPAGAQTYVVSTSSAPFAPLTNPTVPALTGNLDAGYAVVPLGFDFPYFGRLFSQLTITTDGAAYLEPNPGAASYPSNTVFPSGAVPNGVLAPFWDNLRASNPFSRLSHQLITSPSGKVFVVEWRDLNHWSTSATYTLTFQLRLHENGLVQFHYGVFTGGGASLSASVGIENHTGSVGVTGKACTPTCTPQNIVQDELLTFGPAPNTVDLVAGKLVVEAVADDAGLLTLDTRFDLRNFGTDPVAGVEYALFLSSDTVLDPSDLPLSPASQGPLSLGPMGLVSHVASGTVPRPAGGAWYVLAQLDPSDAIAETSNANNLASSATPLVSGLELVALGISASVSVAGPGELITNTLEFTNSGIDPAGPVQWRILLSEDALLDGLDLVVHGGTTTLAGGQTVSLPVTYALPATVPLGSYWFVLQLDPQDAIPELIETNNVVFSQARFHAEQADLLVGVPTLHDPLPPYGLAPQLYFGEPYRMEVVVFNVGGAPARDFTLVAFLSENDILNAVNDPFAGETPPHTLPPGGSALIVLEGIVPAQAPSGATYPAKDYFFFVSGFSNGNFVEINQANNVNRAAAQRVRPPGPDLAPTLVTAPPQLASGEAVAVKRVLRNLGNRPSATVPYRYFLTRNELVSEQDVPLTFLRPDGSAALEGTVALPAGGVDALTEVVLIPWGLPPGEWRVGVRVDPLGVHDDLNPANNGLASVPLELLPPAITVLTPVLPAALLGVAYEFQVGTTGGAAPVTFTLTEGTLPEGLSLDPTGRLHGVPAQLGVFAFTVELEDAQARRAVVRLALQTVAATSALDILTPWLPAAVTDAPYEVWLGVLGGQAPYSWAVAKGALPAGLALESDGRLHGTTEEAPGAEASFELRVFDASGQTAARTFTVRTVATAALYVQTVTLPPAVLGQAYLTDLVARVSGATPPPPPVRWRLLTGRLPAGVAMRPHGPDALILEGTPVESGAFPFALEVVDGAGRADSRELVLVVNPGSQRLVGRYPRAALPGTAIDGTIRLAGEPEATYRVHSGALPPGVLLSEDGALSGRVPEDARLELHAFTVIARAVDGTEGLGAFSLDVTDQLPRGEGCGCGAATPAGALLPWMALALAWARRRRQRM